MSRIGDPFVPTALVVENDASARQFTANALELAGWHVSTAANGFKALDRLRETTPELLVTALSLPGADGIELMLTLRRSVPSVVTLVLVEPGQIAGAVGAMRAGAADCLAKPVCAERLRRSALRALEADSARAARLEDGAFTLGGGSVGESPAWRTVVELVRRVAPSQSTVLLVGESGTGKELVASALHRHSQRGAGPFVAVHCAALSTLLLESELFGHERGAFTGAVVRHAGRFEQADGGTLFLDDVAAIPPELQVKLLRVLQDRCFERVGGNETIRPNVRVVAATNRDLSARVAAKLFREDLFYRLNVVTIELPPLRARRSDIAPLARHFLRHYAERHGKVARSLSGDALRALAGHAWPGNVRELENVIERAVLESERAVVTAASLKLDACSLAPPADEPLVAGASLAELERHAILETLRQTLGSATRAARVLGVSARFIRNRLEQYRREAPDSSPFH